MKRWRIFRLALSMLALLICSGIGAGCFFAAPTYHGGPSAHFDGNEFFSPGATKKPTSSVGALLKWQAQRQPGKWSEFRVVPPGAAPLSQVSMGELRVTFINHATTLVQLDGVNILTDPIYSKRCSPVSFVGPARVRPPGIDFESLPRIDAVVLSHNHYDHMDIPTLKRLVDTWPHMRIFAGLGNKAFLDSQHFPDVVELDWWEFKEFKGITIQSVPNQHFSNRGLGDSNGTLWTAYALKGANGYAYFAGDTGYGSHFSQVYEKLGAPRVAILPIGAYKPEWFMSPVHMSPLEAVQAAADLHAKASVPMHYGTFPLADEGETEASDELKKALFNSPVHFDILDFGEAKDFAQ
jgi:L-ascorbate metabolism protein UlaG (beta-lactamase superfamily)